MKSNSTAHRDLDEVSLADLYRILAARKWFVIAGAILGCAAAFSASQILPKKYEAKILVAPASNSSGEGAMGKLGALASAVEGLGSMAGISLPGSNDAAQTIAVLQSAELTEKFISENRLLPVLYPKLWNSAKREWRTSSAKKIPTLWKANRLFANHIRAITTDDKSGLVTLEITWTNAGQAAQWANDLVEMTNNYLRQKAIQKAQREIKYLQGAAAGTDMVGEKEAIYSIMAMEINKEMLARGSVEYALKVIDPAQAPELPSSPRPILWSIAGMLFGTLFGALSAIAVPNSNPKLDDKVPERS